MTNKKCSKCGEVKLLGEFIKAKNIKSGFGSHCKKCAYLSRSEWCKSNPDKAKEIHQRNISKNPERFKEVQKNSWLKNRDRRLAAGKIWSLNNMDKRRVAATNRIKNLSDGYVKNKLCEGFKIKVNEIPQSLIDLKREQLKLTRLIKEVQK